VTLVICVPSGSWVLGNVAAWITFAIVGAHRRRKVNHSDRIERAEQEDNIR